MVAGCLSPHVMESNHVAQAEPIDTEPGGPGRIPEAVDWVAGAVIALAGMALVLAGIAVVFVVDRVDVTDALAAGIESGEILTDAEAAELALTTGDWTVWGLLLTGGAMVVVAIAYVVHRHRVHQRIAAGDEASDFLGNAVVGAVVSAILSFVPFSPVVGGAVAGYYESAESDRVVGVGALSGLLAAAPVVAIVGFVAVGLALGFVGVQQTGLGILIAVGMLFAMLVIAALGAAFGALGGWAGERLAEN